MLFCSRSDGLRFAKKKMKNLLIILILISPNAFSMEILSFWETARSSDKVQLQYRWIRVGDTLKTREVKISFQVQARQEDIIHAIRNANKISKWNQGIDYCRTYPSTEKSWVLYTRFNIPKPFTNQDLVAQYTVSNYPNVLVIDVSAKPNYLTSYAGTARLKDYQGQWLIKKVNDTTCMVNFISVSFKKPVLPRCIQDPIIQHILLNSFESLIKLLENETISEN